MSRASEMLVYLVELLRLILCQLVGLVFFFSSRRRHTRFSRDWSSDVCSSDLAICTLASRRSASARRVRVRLRSSGIGGLRFGFAVVVADRQPVEDGPEVVPQVLGVRALDQAERLLGVHSALAEHRGQRAEHTRLLGDAVLLQARGAAHGGGRHQRLPPPSGRSIAAVGLGQDTQEHRSGSRWWSRRSAPPCRPPRRRAHHPRHATTAAPARIHPVSGTGRGWCSCRSPGSAPPARRCQTLAASSQLTHTHAATHAPGSLPRITTAPASMSISSPPYLRRSCAASMNCSSVRSSRSSLPSSVVSLVSFLIVVVLLEVFGIGVLLLCDLLLEVHPGAVEHVDRLGPLLVLARGLGAVDVVQHVGHEVARIALTPKHVGVVVEDRAASGGAVLVRPRAHGSTP